MPPNFWDASIAQHWMDANSKVTLYETIGVVIVGRYVPLISKIVI
jgi:hypothetical protein